MAKKQKRSVSAGSTTTVASSTSTTRTAVPRVATPRASYVAEFNPDYTPIISDLKKIGILAGTFITLLVVLSFFLR